MTTKALVNIAAEATWCSQRTAGQRYTVSTARTKETVMTTKDVTTSSGGMPLPVGSCSRACKRAVSASAAIIGAAPMCRSAAEGSSPQRTARYPSASTAAHTTAGGGRSVPTRPALSATTAAATRHIASTTTRKSSRTKEQTAASAHASAATTM